MSKEETKLSASEVNQSVDLIISRIEAVEKDLRKLKDGLTDKGESILHKRLMLVGRRLYGSVVELRAYRGESMVIGEMRPKLLEWEEMLIEDEKGNEVSGNGEEDEKE